MAACQPPPVEIEGEFGRPIALASGQEGGTLPYFVFVDEGCPGAPAAGGCDDPSRPCEPLLIDSLASLSAVRGDTTWDFAETCVEVRSAAGMATPVPQPMASSAAVTRFRYRDLPMLRAPAQGEDWSWRAGGRDAIEVGGVLGGNALNEGALAIRRSGSSGGTASFYGEYPGTEQDLADQGRATLPVQFPGRLLGRELADRCVFADGRECTVDGFNNDLRRNTAIEPTRMVVDACLAVPPCRVHYEQDLVHPGRPGVCSVRPGFDASTFCAEATHPLYGGRQASLLVATAVEGLVLFEDSAVRLLGPLDALPSCDAPEGIAPEARACWVGTEGTLYVSGWRPAGDPALGDPPLVQLRVRSLALVPGLGESRGIGPCERAEQRLEALLGQCTEYTSVLEEVGALENATPPYAADEPSRPGDALAILGEAHWTIGRSAPDPSRWIETLVVPTNHPLPLVLRRDVAPEAIEPDGLLGTALFTDTETILDYTEGIPSVRVSCLDPRSGDCLVAPHCSVDGHTSCCYGLPLNLLVEFIVTGDDETCCPALSAAELAEIQADGHCLATSPP